jgi:hypothetical protein
VKKLTSICIVLFLAVSAVAAPITFDQAQLAARRAAENIWGGLVYIESDQLLNPDGSPAAYGFVFGRNGTSIINQANILEGYNLRQSGHIEEGWNLARDAENYCYVVAALDNNYGPVLEACDGLPSYLTMKYDIQDLGEAYLGGSVEITRYFYLSPLENWYEVGNGQQSVVVNPRRRITLEVSTFTACGSLYDFPGNPTAPAYWTALLTAPLPQLDDEGYIAGVPNFNQTDTDCGPHSSAQAVGYWDNHTYMGMGPWDLLIDVDFWGLRDEMRSAMGWVPGGGVTVQEIRDGILTVCNFPAYNNQYAFDAVLYNNPSYNNCTAAVDLGRPGVIAVFNHPIYGNHAMTLVGYNDTPSQMVQVHDNWPPDTDEPLLNWGVWFDGFVDVFPGGGTTTPITLQTFTARYENGSVRLDWVTGCEIDCYGYNILRREQGDYAQINAELIPAVGRLDETAEYSFIDDQAQAGKTYRYALQALSVHGGAEISGEITLKTLQFDLAQNAPNPFNPTTTIRYEVPEDGFVTLSVFDVSGKEIATLVREYQTGNRYTVTFNGEDLASGIYFYRLQVGESIALKKMVLIK